MTLSDDVKKLSKNQVALNSSFTYLQQKIKKLERRVAFLEGGAPEPFVDEAPATAKVEAKVAKESKETSKPIENLGFKVFGGVGFVLILLGLFYLFRYAVNEGWIGITGRIVLGIILSLLVLGAAEVFKRREYPKFSQLLTGGGLALLYFTFFATYYFPAYRESLGMTLGLNSFLLTIVMIVAVALSLRHDSMLMAGFSFLLGYLSAFLLGIEDGGSFSMLLYALLLSIGMAVVLWKKNWPMGGYPLGASYVLYAIFFFSEIVLTPQVAGSIPSVVVSGFLYLIAFFALFSILALLLKDDEQHVQNIAISVINAALFFGFGLWMVNRYWHSWRGLFVILIAAVYLIMAAIAKERGLKNLFETLFVLGVTFITITMPIQLQGAWVTLAWALEGVLLIQGSAKLKNNRVGILGFLLLLLAGGRALVWDSWQLDYGWRTFSFLVVIAAFAISAYLLREVELSGRKNMQVFLGLISVILLTILIAIEVLDPKGMFVGWSSNARQVLCTIAWAVEAVILILVGFMQRLKAIRLSGLVLFGIVIAKILAIDLGALNNDFARTVVTIFVGVIALGAAFVYVKNKEKIKAFLAEE